MENAIDEVDARARNTNNKEEMSKFEVGLQKHQCDKHDTIKYNA